MADFRHIVTASESGKPLKSIVKKEFDFSSRLMTKLKQQHLVFVNDEAMPGWIALREGDVITIKLPDETSDFLPEDVPINVVYEDGDILVINKDAGYAVHPTKGKPNHTIANGLMKKMMDERSGYKIRLVNRLDMNTSGLLIIAKNSHSQDNLVKQMKAGTVSKRYLALLEGIISDDTGTVDEPLGRPDPNEVERWILPEGKGGFPSITHYRVIDRFRYPHSMKFGNTDKVINGYTLCKLKLETGRTHQIRIHMASLGHPVVGDHLYCHGDPFEYRRVYGDNRPPLTGFKGPRQDTNPEITSDIILRQALHAYSLDFNHPITGQAIHLEADLPEDFKKAINTIKKGTC